MRVEPSRAAKIGLVLVSSLLAGCSPTSGTSGGSTASHVHNDLTGMACPSASFCMAVGNSYITGTAGFANYRTLVERWNGSAWSLVDSPDGAKQDSHLFRVSCPTISLCFAVGYDGPDIPTERVLIQRWNGASWSIADNPKISAAKSSRLDDVACANSSLCFAVGQYCCVAGDSEGLIERWDGSSWTVMPDVRRGLLQAVGCATAVLCFALGTYFLVEGGSHVVGHQFIERWDGTSWRVVESPDPDSILMDAVGCGTALLCGFKLGGMTCVSAYCFVSGYLGDGQLSDVPMMEVWDGSSWSIVVAPRRPVLVSPAKIDDRFTSVSCASKTFCFAVGSHRWRTPEAHSDTLFERWNGSSWTIVLSPNGSPNTGDNNGLEAIACPNASRCLAIGHHDNTDGYFQTLAQVWNGVSWSIVPSANRSG